MILLNFFIGFFALFITPHLLLYYYTSFRYSLVIIYGFIISLSLVWFGLLISFYLKIPNTLLIIAAWITTVISWYFVFKTKAYHKKNSSHAIINTHFLTLLLIAPAVIHYGGNIYSGWDAIASWNRWALELSENQYHPIDAAYPLLIPALLALFYKLQGTLEVWWSVKLLLFILPYITLASLLTLYHEKKDIAYIWFTALLYPYLLSPTLFSGYVDMPVMVMGTLVLVLIYTAEIEESREYSTRYLIAAILLAGLVSITKQAGSVFLIFTFIYIALNFKYLQSKKIILRVSLLALLYLATYLILYLQYSHHEVFGNIGYLKKITKGKKLLTSNTLEYYTYLWKSFFSYPASPPLIKSILKPLHTITVTPILILLAYLLYLFKPLRKYTGAGFLSAVFFITGTIIWIKFFSYSERNSFWVKSFFILFAGINFTYFTARYRNLFSGKKILFALFLTILGYVILLGDNYTIKRQQKYQLQLGNPKTAQLLADILKKSKSCTKLYTTEDILRFNTILIPYRNRTVPLLDVGDFSKYLEHNCSSGEYFLFRKQSIFNENWSYVTKLVKYDYLKAVNNDENVLLFYVPEKLDIPKTLLRYKTSIITLKHAKILKDIQFNIDKFKTYDAGLILRGWGIIKGSQIDNAKKYMVLQNKLHTFIIDTTTLKRKDVTKTLHAKNLDNAGFKAKIYFDDFPKGKYKLYLLLVDPNDRLWHMGLVRGLLKIGE